MGTINAQLKYFSSSFQKRNSHAYIGIVYFTHKLFFPLAPSVRIHRPAELLTLRRRDSLPLKASNSVRPFHSYTVVDRHIRRHLTE